MSFSLADSTGLFDEFASIGGLVDFVDWALVQTPTIRALAREGFTEDLDQLKQELSVVPIPVKVQAQVRTILGVVDDAEDVLIITDGMSDELRTLRRRPATSPILDAADAQLPQLEAAVLLGFAAGKAALRKASKSAPPDAQGAVGAMRRAWAKVLAPSLRKALLAGGTAGADLLLGKLRTAEACNDFRPDHNGECLNCDEWADEHFRTAKKTDTPKIDFAFDVKNQAAIDWADKHAAELVTNISETTRDAINNATAEFLETGDFEEHFEEILAAVGDEDRAKLIARNESMIAVHEGQREAWDQAVEAGVLTGDEEREWIIVGDDKVCEICLGLEGKRAKLGETYLGEDGEEYLGPPAHVNCRCSEGIV